MAPKGFVQRGEQGQRYQLVLQCEHNQQQKTSNNSVQCICQVTLKECRLSNPAPVSDGHLLIAPPPPTSTPRHVLEMGGRSGLPNRFRQTPKRPCNRFVPARNCRPTAFPTPGNRFCSHL